VIDGLTAVDVAAAMRAGIGAVVALGAGHGVRRISAGDYGGKLGRYHFRLHEIMA
jgi:formylmethanofuran--tetrahydromethanopterin N-formyltransferase